MGEDQVIRIYQSAVEKRTKRGRGSGEGEGEGRMVRKRERKRPSLGETNSLYFQARDEQLNKN